MQNVRAMGGLSISAASQNNDVAGAAGSGMLG